MGKTPPLICLISHVRSIITRLHRKTLDSNYTGAKNITDPKRDEIITDDNKKVISLTFYFVLKDYSIRLIDMQGHISVIIIISERSEKNSQLISQIQTEFSLLFYTEKNGDGDIVDSNICFVLYSNEIKNACFLAVDIEKKLKEIFQYYQ